MGKNVIISTLPNISQNYLPKVNTSNIFANSLVYDDGSSVLINTTTASAFKLDVNGTARTGALTLTGALSGTSATFSGNIRGAKLSLGTGITTFPINVEDATQSNTYFTLFNTIGTAGATSGLRFGVANGTITAGNVAEIVARGLTAADAAMDLKVMYNYSLVTALTLGSNGAATFSSSVTATNAFFGSAITSAATLHVNNTSSADPTSLSSIPTTNVFGMSTSPGGMLAAGIGTTGGTHVWLQGRNVAGAGVSYPIVLQPLGGNVGIGTTAPGTKLDVNTGISSSSGTAIMISQNTDGAVKPGASFGLSIQNGGEATNAADLWFRTASGGSLTERMRITSGGNVGIGTTSPDTYSYGGSRSFLTFRANGTNQEPFLQLIADGTGNSLIDFGNATIRRATIIGFDGSHLAFFTNGSNSGTTTNERMRITNAGHILVNTQTATWANSLRGLVEINGSSGGTALLGLKIADSQKAYFYHNNSNLYIEQMNAGQAIYMISYSGGVYLSAGATSWTANSDERLKDITGTIDNAVGALSTLRTVKHTWKSDLTKQEHLALIAQDVEKVFPQLIDKNKLPSKPDVEQTDNTEYLGVRYTELVPVLVKAIQELKAENDQQKADIESLKALINK